MNNLVTDLHISPLLPMEWIWGLTICFSVLMATSLWRFRHGVGLRTLAALVLMLVLLNPSFLEEERQPTRDVAVVVVDRTTSQNFGDRTAQTDKALTYLQEKLGTRDDLDLRVIEADNTQNKSGETRLFAKLDETLADAPKARRAGVILLTDGQVHDPLPEEKHQEYGPIHTLLTGQKDEYDRRIAITNAPAYGITGQSVSVSFRVEDNRARAGSDTLVVMRDQNGAEEVMRVNLNEEYSVDVPIEHAGQNVFEISTDVQKGEVTDVNNKAPILINGVRDRLKVLLVSGKPHMGERSWRNLLSSDPGVDLVHFTILRELSKRDNTPQNELSLIPFPFRELFEVKLYDFDLIIFDNYRLKNILPLRYFENIVHYVEKGGALLEASGAAYADKKKSIYYSPLGRILPGEPSGNAATSPYKPKLTSKGTQHPVTRNLRWGNTDDDWGQWLLQTQLNAKSGNILMSGIEGHPLLILDRVKEGRVAQIASDNLWLWAKGYDGGGPHAELSRRIVHWLMKEPALDEQEMQVEVNGDSLFIRVQNYERETAQVRVQKPDGSEQVLSLKDNGSGWFEERISTNQPGIYRLENENGKRKFAVVGSPNPPEMRDVRSTDHILSPIADNSKGYISRLAQDETPQIRFLEGDYTGRFGGWGWLGLRQNGDYVVASAQNTPLLTPWLSLFLLLLALALMWWIEGRKSS